MERGLLWLPLLIAFIWLAWAGWNEYQKIETYKNWATDFERAKYDIYAALGQTGDRLIWGRPTRKGLQDIQEVSLSQLTEIELYDNDHKPPSDANVPKGCTVGLGITTSTGERRWIPFTDEALASAWKDRLQTLRESLQSTPHP